MLIGALPVLGSAPAHAVPSAATAASMASPGALEADFVGRINALRASRGLGALTVDPQLTSLARSWAQTMAGQGRIFHASSLSAGVTANWSKLGENVGTGGEIGSLFQAFVDSPSHYANLVDPKFTHVGVGVVVSGNVMFTTHRFMALGPPPAPAPPPTAAPAPAPPPSAPPTTAAPTTTVPPTTTTTTTTAPPEPSKLGPLDRIRALVEAG
jgi:hypothetical protein